jgi:hypothetical protein
MTEGNRYTKVPEILSLRHNWGGPPHPQASVLPPPTWVLGGEPHSLAGERVGGTNSDEGTETFVLCVYYNISRNGHRR